jgi:hypothetical protein
VVRQLFHIGGEWEETGGNNSRNASVTAGKLLQVSHADFFPYPAKQDVISQPVKAWNTGNALALLEPKAAASS